MGLHEGQGVLTVEQIGHPSFTVRETEHGHHQCGAFPTDEKLDLSPIKFTFNAGFTMNPKIHILWTGSLFVLLAFHVFTDT